jgi:hypothetical protein
MEQRIPLEVGSILAGLRKLHRVRFFQSLSLEAIRLALVIRYAISSTLFRSMHAVIGAFDRSIVACLILRSLSIPMS